MKSFDKFNVEAMVHHIALKEGMSYDEVLNEIAPLLAAPLVVPAAKAALTGVGAWAAYNAAKKLMPQQRQQTPAVDYGQSTVTKAQTSTNQPTGARGSEGSVTARRQAQRAARQPTPEPPKPPKPPRQSLIKRAVTAVGGAAAAVPSLSGTKQVGPPGTKPAVPTPDPDKPLSPESQKAAETIFKLKPGSLKTKPEPEKEQEPPKPAIPTGQEPKPKPKPAQPTRLQGFRTGPFTYTPPASPRPPRSYEIKPRIR